MAAVVNAFLMSGALQIAVCHIRPCSSPQDKLLVTVPSFRDIGSLYALASYLYEQGQLDRAYRYSTY